MPPRTIQCAECRHDHEAKHVENLTEHREDLPEEMMCVWCQRSDYANDPLRTSEEAQADFERLAGGLLQVDPKELEDESEEVLSRREAAQRAGVHYNTIKSWEKSGRLPSTRIGKRVWVKVADLEKARVL